MHFGTFTCSGRTLLSSNLTHPIQEIFSSTPPTRLKSRKPFWTEGKILYEKPFNINQNWREEWDSINVTNKFLVDDPTARPPGFTLPRKKWSTLNRFRTGQGRSGHLMQKWGYVDDPQCPCGQIQTMQHIIEDCPSYSLRGGLIQLHSLSESAETWLKSDSSYLVTILLLTFVYHACLLYQKNK